MGIWFNAAMAVFAATGSFLFGYDSGVITDTIQSPNFLTFFETTANSQIVGAVVATYSGGAVFGSFMGGVTTDVLGRKKTIQLGAFICMIGAILQTAAQNLAMILVGRILTGWAVGLMSMSVPIYQSECAHPKNRGLMVGINQQMIGVGFIVSSWVGFGAAKVPDSSSFSWRFPLGIQVAPCLIIIFGLFFFPESPRYLVESNQIEEGERVLRRLHYDGTNEDWIKQEFEDIKATISAEKNVQVQGWKPMFQVPVWRTRLMHATLVQLFTQMTGVNVIAYYQTTMYENLGFSHSKTLLVTGIGNLVGPITNLIFILYLSDRIGRVKPLIFGAIGISVALVCEAGINSQIKLDQNGPVGSPALPIAGVFFIFCVSIIFSLSFGPVSWVYMAEIMPMQIRGKGSAFATGVGNWLVGTIWAQVAPLALSRISYKFYFLFVAFNLLVTLPTVYFTFKETKQKSLEDIDLLFEEATVKSARSLGQERLFEEKSQLSDK